MKAQIILVIQFIVIEVKIEKLSGLDDEMYEFGIFENFKKTKDILLLENVLMKRIIGELSIKRSNEKY